MTERPNIVLIITDQWREDCLSVAGHPVVHTPYLDQLSLKGARFYPRRTHSFRTIHAVAYRGREKFIWCSGNGRTQFFDLDKDP